MAGVSEILGAGASLASIVGLGVQIYLIGRERRRPPSSPPPAASAGPARATGSADSTNQAGVPVGVRWNAATGAGRIVPAGAEHASSVPVPGADAPAKDSGLGAFLLGVWQLVFILNGYGWVAQPAQMQEYSSVATEGVPGHLRMLVVVLAVNAAWAALLLRRHWPAADQGFAVVKDRFWFYLAYAPLSAVGAVALLIVRSGQIF
ncbi:MAG TPA: hypothetical protein VF163_12970 [Micromonosporaceae bacterium]